VTVTGVDEFPLDELRGTVLTNNRGGAAAPISEWVLAMMLAFEKDLPRSWIDEPTEQWYVAPLGTLQGRRLALLGLGSIGEAVARKALAFEMSVVAMRRSDRPSPVDGAELVDSLEQLVHDADHLVIAAPLTDSTRHLIDEHAFSLMTPGVHLVNVSRGGIVDQDALHRALDGDIVACASLDAVDPEPPPNGDWLYSHPKVRLSPHISNNSPLAFDLMMAIFWSEVRRRLDRQPLHNIVDPAAQS
jgi:phosphoglycerate dehydrogenase-like enzyme